MIYKYLHRNGKVVNVTALVVTGDVFDNVSKGSYPDLSVSVQ